MAIDIRIRIDLTPRQKKIMRIAVVTGTVIGAIGIGVAIAAPLQLTWIQSGQQVSASSLLDNMNELNRRTILTTDAGVSFSVGATKFCGTSPATTTGAISYNGAMGYAAAKAMCQASTGCNTSPTAHMCSTEELERSMQLGMAPSTGWYSSGAFATWGSMTAYVQDCTGWTKQDNGEFGLQWAATQPTPSACGTAQPVLCCD
jgi:hypothetical protein